jgi:hypothetical protein
LNFAQLKTCLMFRIVRKCLQVFEGAPAPINGFFCGGFYVCINNCTSSNSAVQTQVASK